MEKQYTFYIFNLNNVLYACTKSDDNVPPMLITMVT